MLILIIVVMLLIKIVFPHLSFSKMLWRIFESILSAIAVIIVICLIFQHLF